MRYMANSRLAEGVTPERLNEYIDNNGISSSAWELVRHRVVTDYAFKVGTLPGSCCSWRSTPWRRHRTS